MSRFQRNVAIQVLQKCTIIKWRNMFLNCPTPQFRLQTHLWFLCIVVEYIC